MRNRGRSVVLVLAAAVLIYLTACKRSDSAASAQAATGAIAQPVPQKPQAPPSVPAAPAQPTSSSPVAASPSAPAATSDAAIPTKTTAADVSQSFAIAGHTFRMHMHVQRIDHGNGLSPDETVEWWELLNSKDQVLYREAYPVSATDGGFDFRTNVTATPFTTKEGAGIVVQRGEEPSEPGPADAKATPSVQVFAYKYGREKYGADESLFQSFGPPISVEGEYVGLETDTSRPKPTLPPGITMMTMDDILKFKIWTGNFYVMYPVRINWITGNLEPGVRCMEMTPQGRTRSCSYPVEVESHREGEPTFVRLYPQADGGSTPKHIILQPDTKVEYLEARLQFDWVSQGGKSINVKVNGDVWLKVRIGGQEGWIHSQEDFDALGVSLAG